MSRIRVFAWVALGSLSALVLDHTPNTTTMAAMMIGAGIALSAHWALERRA